MCIIKQGINKTFAMYDIIIRGVFPELILYYVRVSLKRFFFKVSIEILKIYKIGR